VKETGARSHCEFIGDPTSVTVFLRLSDWKGHGESRRHTGLPSPFHSDRNSKDQRWPTYCATLDAGISVGVGLSVGTFVRARKTEPGREGCRYPARPGCSGCRLSSDGAPIAVRRWLVRRRRLCLIPETVPRYVRWPQGVSRVRRGRKGQGFGCREGLGWDGGAR